MQTLGRARFGNGGLLSGGSARLGGRYVYELPWYLFIGAPGSGKTTALERCGLQFPLQSRFGQSAVQGVGGTRNCDWWFTDQAVLIDTAGRFTTQDSDAANDRATWAGFLSILKRSRPRQPINGVLLTVSVPDLLARTVAERQHYAATVRTRIQELNESLGIAIPIYLLVTKCLDDVAEHADFVDRAHHAVDFGGGTDDHAHRVGLQFTREAQELDAIHQRHPEVGDDQVERVVPDPGECVVRLGDRLDARDFPKGARKVLRRADSTWGSSSSSRIENIPTPAQAKARVCRAYRRAPAAGQTAGGAPA